MLRLEQDTCLSFTPLQNGSTIDADRAQRLFQMVPQMDLAAGGQLSQDP